MHYFFKLSTLALMAIVSSCVTGLGINCRGSSNCGPFRNPYNPFQSVADSLREEIAYISDSRWYRNGQHIVCVDGYQVGRRTTSTGSICAFLQGTNGLPGYEVKKLAERIVEHGCNTCGSVPVFFDKGDNDVKSHGELTFNYVYRSTLFDRWCGRIRGTCQYQ